MKVWALTMLYFCLLKDSSRCSISQTSSLSISLPQDWNVLFFTFLIYQKQMALINIHKLLKGVLISISTTTNRDCWISAWLILLLVYSVVTMMNLSTTCSFNATFSNRLWVMLGDKCWIPGAERKILLASHVYYIWREKFKTSSIGETGRLVCVQEEINPELCQVQGGVLLKGFNSSLKYDRPLRNWGVSVDCLALCIVSLHCYCFLLLCCTGWLAAANDYAVC